MEVKVQCGCGVRYAFDVEPVNGQLPMPIACPKCGADGTAFANMVIAEKLAQQPQVTQPQAGIAPPRGTSLRVSVSRPATHDAPPQAAPVAMGNPGASFCSRHPRNPSSDRCFVCQKPICPECMSQFGYLCSVHCRYQAEQQGIRVPIYENQKNRVEARQWRKYGFVGAGIALAVLLVIAALGWYEYVGSRPRPMYSLSFSEGNEPLYAQLIEKDKLLLLEKKRLAVHDIKGKKDIWSFAIPEDAPVEEERSLKRASFNDDDEDAFYTPYWGESRPEIHRTENEIWICSGRTLLSVDAKTGAEKTKVPLPGKAMEFVRYSDALFVTSLTPQRKKVMTRVDLSSGAAKHEELALTRVQSGDVPVEAPPGFVLTAGYLLFGEIEQERRDKARKKVYSQFIPTGPNAVEMRVKMIYPRITMVESIKRKEKSAINENLSASTSIGVVAEEIFNDLKRSGGGGHKEIDESQYRVTVRRLMASDTQPWTSEVTGPPAFFPMKTVDLLVAGKSLFVFDKNNKKIFETTLTYTIGESYERAGSEPPALEVGNTLYFYDQGVLTAFELPSCNVRWRLTSVGISKVQPDGKGNLYVNTTSASRDDIQYSDQIKITHQDTELLLKVDEKSGTILWTSKYKGTCAITGKFLYAANVHVGGLAFTEGLREALNQSSGFGGGGTLRLYRMDAGNGKEKWEYFQKEAPGEIGFFENRILFNYGDRIEVLKYLSF